MLYFVSVSHIFSWYVVHIMWVPIIDMIINININSRIFSDALLSTSMEFM